MIWRGLTRRCPQCGSRHIFDGYFELAERCSSCGLDFERNPGAFIGGVGVNTTVTALVLVVALVLSLIYLGDQPWYWGLAPMVGVAVAVPLLFFGTSKTLWLALEFVFVPPEPPSGS